MRIILGVLEPDAGEVRWRGERILGYLGKQSSTAAEQKPIHLSPR
jgi:ABC-type transport system involved in cytochrome c biogenesis ATPase subunit